MEKYYRPYKVPPQTLDPEEILNKYRLVVEKAITEAKFLESPLSKDVRDAMETGGKRLRPVLVLMACEAVSGQYTTSVPAAIAYEFAHEASLVQDDIIDDSDLRHDKESVHKARGKATAILISDLMIFEIFDQLAKYGESDLTKKKMAGLMSYMTRAANLTIKGEYLEVEMSKRSIISEQDYLEVAGLKTGSLLAAATASGALIGGGSRRIVEAMYRFGYNLGIAFQIRDDILDISGDSVKLGKPIMKDLQNNACNIVLINALEKADPYRQNLINSLLYKRWFGLSEVKDLLRILRESKSINYASRLVEQFTTESRKCLGVLRESATKDRLTSLTYMLETRSA